ncbi:MAG: hypothetical protein HWD92_02965 [Flavobacteriia bacterium]|nr:hypothetical protein [Flavobacteriia bacterium]
MKKTIYTVALVLGGLWLSAQTKPTENAVNFELGSGLNFMANDGLYAFHIRGMVQPYYGYESIGEVPDAQYFNVRRSYLSFGGEAINEKFSFFVQLDFSNMNPLLDAWGAYEPWEDVQFTVGQKQNIANNREMLFMENQLQFADRSLLSSTFSRTGREFGFFFDAKIGDKFGIVPQVAITSGDGRNSFGADSRDVDLGGFKSAARLDVYPLGYFAEGNDVQVADLMHESSPKLALGGAVSYNAGASNSVGEGHGDFSLYDRLGNSIYPDYRQLYADVLFKFQGFSLLGEYSVSTATALNGTFTTVTGDELMPTEISEYLALGSSYNVQLGYVTRSGYAIDVRYTDVAQEFEQNTSSLVQNSNAMSLGLTKYFKGNALKIHAALTSVQVEGVGGRQMLGELMLQVML